MHSLYNKLYLLLDQIEIWKEFSYEKRLISSQKSFESNIRDKILWLFQFFLLVMYQKISRGNIKNMISREKNYVPKKNV